MSPSHVLRPGTWADLPAATSLYLESFAGEPLLDRMFPGRREDPLPFRTWLARRFRLRYWTPGYFLTMVFAREQDVEDDVEEDGEDDLDDESVEKSVRSKNGDGRPVAFSWWHRPAESLSFYDRWLSPFALARPFVTTILRLHDRLFPIPGVNKHDLGIYDRTFALIEPQVLSTPRRRAAWYLSNLGVDPAVQSRGLGAMLVRDGLLKVDAAGAAAWVVGLRGTETYYGRFGFVEVARANIGELEDWEGGSVMFRNA